MAFMLAPSLDRSRVAQWTVPVVYWYSNIAVRTRNVQPDLWTAFFSPFHWSVSVVCGTFFYCRRLPAVSVIVPVSNINFHLNYRTKANQATRHIHIRNKSFLIIVKPLPFLLIQEGVGWSFSYDYAEFCCWLTCICHTCCVCHSWL